MTDQHQGRLYGEEEIGALLRRATELQDAGHEPRSFGLSAAELKQIAEDAGIDPRYVERALAEATAPPSMGKRNWWGGPVDFRTSRVIDYEVDDDSWEAMVSEIRRAYKDTGSVDTWGKALEWRHSRANGAQGHVQLSRRNGQTRLDVFHKNPKAAILSYIFAFVSGLMAIPIVDEALTLSFGASLTVFLSFLAAITMTARFLVARDSDKHDTRFSEMADHLVQIAEEDRDRLAEAPVGLGSTVASRMSAPEHRIDLDAALGDGRPDALESGGASRSGEPGEAQSSGSGTSKRRTP